MGRSVETLQIHIFGPMIFRHKPGIYFTYPIVLCTINDSLCMLFIGFLRLLVKNPYEKTCKKNPWSSPPQFCKSSNVPILLLGSYEDPLHCDKVVWIGSELLAYTSGTGTWKKSLFFLVKIPIVQSFGLCIMCRYEICIRWDFHKECVEKNLYNWPMV